MTFANAHGVHARRTIESCETAAAGLAAVIIDVDPQANAANWKDRREAEPPRCRIAPASCLKQILAGATAHGAQFIVIDTPGQSDSAAIDAAIEYAAHQTGHIVLQVS